MWTHTPLSNSQSRATQAADVYRSMQHPIAYKYVTDRPKQLEHMLHPSIVSAHVVYYKLRRYYGRNIDWPTFELQLMRLFDLGWLYPMRTCQDAPLSLIYVNVFALAHLLESAPELVEPSEPDAPSPRRPAGSLLGNVLAAVVGALPGFARVAVLDPTTMVILAVQGVSYTAGTSVARLGASDDYTAFGCEALGIPRYAHDGTWQWLHVPAVPLVSVCPDVSLVRRLVGLFGGYPALRLPIDPCTLYAPGFLADPRLALVPLEAWAAAPEQQRAWLFWAAELEHALASLDGAPVVPRHLKLTAKTNDPDGVRFVHPCNFLLDLQSARYPYADDTIERDVVLDTTPPSVGFELPDDPSLEPLRHCHLGHVPLCRSKSSSWSFEASKHGSGSNTNDDPARLGKWPTWYDVPFEPPFTNSLFELLANPWTSGRVGPWPSRLIVFGDHVYPFSGYALQAVELGPAPSATDFASASTTPGTSTPTPSVVPAAPGEPALASPAPRVPIVPRGEPRTRAEVVVLRASCASGASGESSDGPADAVEPDAVARVLVKAPSSAVSADAYLADLVDPAPRRTLDTPFDEPLALRAVLGDGFLAAYGRVVEPVTPGVQAAAERCRVPPVGADGSEAAARILRTVAPVRRVTTLAPVITPSAPAERG